MKMDCLFVTDDRGQDAQDLLIRDGFSVDAVIADDPVILRAHLQDPVQDILTVWAAEEDCIVSAATPRGLFLYDHQIPPLSEQGHHAGPLVAIDDVAMLVELFFKGCFASHLYFVMLQSYAVGFKRYSVHRYSERDGWDFLITKSRIPSAILSLWSLFKLLCFPKQTGQAEGPISPVHLLKSCLSPL